MTDFLQRALLAVKKRMWLASPRPEVWLAVAVRVVDVVLVVLLAASLAQLTLAFLSGWLSPTIRPAPAGGASAAEPANPVGQVDYATIADWHLFGRVEASQPPPPPPVMPVTPLNLRLAGVFFIERGDNRALALIAEGSGLERGYRIGDALPGGARLERIQRDHVVVSRQGRQEVLNLPKLDEAVRPPSSVPEDPSPVEPMPEPEAEPTGAGEPQVIDATAVAQTLRDEAAIRPQVLENIAFANPYVRNGQFIGFRLRPGRDRRLLRQLSLNSGDVITEVNGIRMTNPIQGLSILQQVLSADQIHVRVLRGDAEIPLIFSLNEPVP